MKLTIRRLYSAQDLNKQPVNDSQREEVASDVAALTANPENLKPEDVEQATTILNGVTNTTSLTTTVC